MKKYFIIKETPVCGLQVTYDKEAISYHKKNRIGWFVLATNDIKDKVKALEIYHSNDAVEKNFDDLKNALDMKQLRIHTNNYGLSYIYSVYSPDSDNHTQGGYDEP